MKMLQKILIMCALVLGMSAVVSAQKEDKRPPKDKPPVVNPQPKPTPEPKKPKPNTVYFAWRSEAGEEA